MCVLCVEYDLTSMYLCFSSVVDPTTGHICADVLSAGQWSPSYSLRPLLLNLQSLFTDANLESPLNESAAALYVNQPQLFWARVYETHERNMAWAASRRRLVADALTCMQCTGVPSVAVPPTTVTATAASGAAGTTTATTNIAATVTAAVTAESAVL